MIQELIFILVVIVIILAIIARQPRSILCTDSSTATSRNQTSHTVLSKPRAKTTRVRFSPDKKERLYSIKTGEIIGDNIVPVSNTEVEN